MRGCLKEWSEEGCGAFNYFILVISDVKEPLISETLYRLQAIQLSCSEKLFSRIIILGMRWTSPRIFYNKKILF
jgi:hypothetical protein